MLVAERPRAGEVAEPGRGRIVAVALAGGGTTAHAAIVARSLGVPLVAGAGDGLLAIAGRRGIVVDGDRGLVCVEPDAERPRTRRRAVGPADARPRRTAAAARAAGR